MQFLTAARRDIFRYIERFYSKLCRADTVKEGIAMKHVLSHTAPFDMVQEDFRKLDSALRLRTTWDVERLILIQSVQGHAHEGHGVFRRKYPNTRLDDISRALRLNPAWVRAARQQLIDEIKEYVSQVIAGESRPPLSNGDGVGLLGSGMFNGMDISGHDVLRGIYLGGLRDDTAIRFDMEQQYGITIGGGKCYLVNTSVMESMGLNGDVLAHSSHEDMLEYYRDTGLIAADYGTDGGDLDYMYIRHRRGRGASDDAAIIAAGLIWGYGTAIGVFLSDAIDTLEKYVPVYSDQDDELAQFIAENYRALDVDKSNARQLAYYSAIPGKAPIDVPDSSLRHLMAINTNHDLTLIESHLLFIQGKRTPSIKMGIECTPSHDLYHYIKGRIITAPKEIRG